MLRYINLIFCKKKSIFLTQLLSLIAFIIYLFLYIVTSNDSFFIYYEKDVIKLSFFLFIIFLYTSYVFFCLDEVELSRECFVANNFSLKIKVHQVIYYIILSLIYCLVAVFFLIIDYLLCFIGQHLIYIYRIIIDVFLNIFLVLLSSIFISLVISLIKRKIIAYLALLIVTVVASPYFYNLFSRSDFFEFISIFNMNIYSDFMPNHAFGISSLPYRWLKPIICFLLCMLIIIFKNKNWYKYNCYKIHSSFVVFLLIFSIILYSLPKSIVDMSEYYQYKEIQYYNENVIFSKAPNFNITKCYMNLNIKRQLNAEVTINIDNYNLDKYFFTLYHGYKIECIIDKKHNLLHYERDSDYIIVYNNDFSDISEITFKYKGCCSTFYSNYQGSYLSGAFAYYPKAGWYNVYNSDFQSYNYVIPEKPIEFWVSVDCNKNVYSNLPCINNQVFAGKSKAVTIISGLYNEINYKGIYIIYPFLAKELVSISSIEEEVSKILASPYFLEDTLTKIICIPNMNNYEYFPVYSGCVEVISIKQVYDVYLMSIVPEEKKLLYYLLNIYINQESVIESLSEPLKEIIKEIDYIFKNDNNALDNLQEYIFRDKNKERYDKIFKLK